MEPWERHAAGAGMKRFSYAAVSDLENQSHAGFLITCAFRREKSATHEIFNLLSQYVARHGEAENTEETARKCFSLIKLSGSGIVFLATSENLDVVEVLKKVLEDIEAGSQKPSVFCNRLSPVQATCSSNNEAIQSTVLKLLKAGMAREQKLKYAVAFNKRAGEDGGSTLERSGCIEAVAKAMQEFSEESSADLSNPEIIVAVEMLPVVGLKDGPLCGVSILPKEVVNIKPRIAIKPLAAEDKNKKRKLAST